MYIILFQKNTVPTIYLKMHILYPLTDYVRRIRKVFTLKISKVKIYNENNLKISRMLNKCNIKGNSVSHVPKLLMQTNVICRSKLEANSRGYPPKKISNSGQHGRNRTANSCSSTNTWKVIVGGSELSSSSVSQ